MTLAVPHAQADTPGPHAPPALTLAGVTYRYPGSRSGVSDIDLQVPSGTIYGLLGANGAGKTTLMRLMLGLLPPDRGQVRCFGEEITRGSRAVLARVASLIETPSLYQHLTAREHLGVFRAYTGAPAARIDEVLGIVGLSESAAIVVNRFSLGMKQRLSLATALLHDPALLVLDEPTNGLDPVGIVGMRELLVRLCREHGKTVIVSSHLLAEVEKTVTHVAVVHQGRIRFDGPASDLSSAAGGAGRVRLRVASPAQALGVLAGEAHAADEAGGWIELAQAADADVARAIRSLAASGVDVYETARRGGTLEDDFLQLLKEGGDAR
ncbi:ABC transporter ATP-binding protein [Longimicrobium sp.]|jgi:ABC-2 type transport system ATP-binding protein|uniref:ABC transporter ATP-binding protein n=1 Tax=Longimicrobium sp. TaxID=2029185 RepID=UPI002ED8481C